MNSSNVPCVKNADIRAVFKKAMSSLMNSYPVGEAINPDGSICLTFLGMSETDIESVLSAACEANLFVIYDAIGQKHASIIGLAKPTQIEYHRTKEIPTVETLEKYVSNEFPRGNLKVFVNADGQKIVYRDGCSEESIKELQELRDELTKARIPIVDGENFSLVG